MRRDHFRITPERPEVTQASPKIRVEYGPGHATVVLANPPMNVVSTQLTREL
jgi:hypothetical protein